MANVFGSILDLFKGKSESVLGIDIGSSSIKVVQLQKKNGRAVLQTYGEVSLGPYGGFEMGRATNLPINKLAEALSDVLKEASVTTNRAGIAIPLSSSLISVFEVPVLGEGELGQLVAIEARKYIPVPMPEVTLDWKLIPKPEEGISDLLKNNSSGWHSSANVNQMNRIEKNEVLVVAIHNDTINRFNDLVKRTNLNASFFELEVFSTTRVAIDDDNSPEAVFDLGASSTKLYISEKGIIRASHTVNIGSQDITLALSRSLGVNISEAERLKRRFGLEVKRGTLDVKEVMSASLLFVFSEATKLVNGYQKRYGKIVRGVTLTGGGVHLKGLLEIAKTSLPIPVNVANPFNKTEAPAFIEPILTEAGPEFSVAIGVALRMLEEVE